jgi:hypothetical protein
MCPGGRRQRGGGWVEACCYLGRDETGNSKRVETVNSGFGDRRDGNGQLLSLLGARGLAGGHREVHCCCSDEEDGSAESSQLIGSPRLTAFPVIAAAAHGPCCHHLQTHRASWATLARLGQNLPSSHNRGSRCHGWEPPCHRYRRRVIHPISICPRA